MSGTARLRKVQPALAFATKNLDQDLSLDVLASQAGLSPFHLQRIFAATTGESPKQLTLRLRLERSAALLLTSHDSVLEIALACGFQSHEVFLRAFRRHFETTPRDYRKHGMDPASARSHADQIAQAGPCLGLFHYTDTVSPEKANMIDSIRKTTIAPQHVLVVRRKVKPDDIAKTLGEVFHITHLYAQKSGAVMTGPPFTRYLEWGPGLLTMEAGMPVAVPSPSGEGEVRAEVIPGGNAATTIHTGPYDQLTSAHAAVQQWIEAQGLVANGAPWESYITDPAHVPDPKDWKTEIFWPVA